MDATQRNARGNEMFGLKKTKTVNDRKVYIVQISSTNEFLSTRFVGPGGYSVKTWKTFKGAKRASQQFTGSEVFPIENNVMLLERTVS